jgi:hypothetical protein
VQVDDDALILAANDVARIRASLQRYPADAVDLTRARDAAGDLARRVFLSLSSDVSPPRGMGSTERLAAAYAERLSLTLSRCVMERADPPATDILDDVWHLCRHLGVVLAPTARAAGAGAAVTIRPHLQRAIAERRATAVGGDDG